MKGRRALALIVACTFVCALIAVPASAAGESATVFGNKGSEVWAAGSATWLGTDGVTGLPNTYYRYSSSVGVVDADAGWWFNAGSGGDRHSRFSHLGDRSGAWASLSDVGTDPLSEADDVYVDFVPADSLPSLAKWAEGGRGASLHGTIAGTRREWHGSRLVYDPWGFPDLREPDFVRPYVMRADINWEATELTYTSRDVSQPAGTSAGVWRTDERDYAAAAVGSMVGDDGVVWWDGAFDDAGIEHRETFLVIK